MMTGRPARSVQLGQRLHAAGPGHGPSRRMTAGRSAWPPPPPRRRRLLRRFNPAATRHSAEQMLGCWARRPPPGIFPTASSSATRPWASGCHGRARLPSRRSCQIAIDRSNLNAGRQGPSVVRAPGGPRRSPAGRGRDAPCREGSSVPLCYACRQASVGAAPPGRRLHEREGVKTRGSAEASVAHLGRNHQLHASAQCRHALPAAISRQEGRSKGRRAWSSHGCDWRRSLLGHLSRPTSTWPSARSTGPDRIPVGASTSTDPQCVLGLARSRSGAGPRHLPLSSTGTSLLPGFPSQPCRRLDGGWSLNRSPSGWRNVYGGPPSSGRPPAGGREFGSRSPT